MILSTATRMRSASQKMEACDISACSASSDRMIWRCIMSDSLLLVGRRVVSAEFLRATSGQNVADFISPQRGYFFSPLINSFASNAKRLR